MKLSSVITHGETVILKNFVDNNNVNNFTGVILSASDVFSICNGVVVQVKQTKDNNTYVCIQYDVNTFFRYMNIVDCDLQEGQTVLRGARIGRANKNRLLFEYCNLVKSDWPVRVGHITIYKHDPTSYILDDIQFASKQLQLGKTDEDDSKYILSSMIAGEFGIDMKGDDDV